MSAARVLNPAVLEFCKIRASPAAVSRNLPCGRQLNRIKRDLFGPANPVEINKIFNEELEKHQEKAIKKWGFDFRTGAPLVANSQFIWERVSFQESTYAPEMYTLTRAAHVRPVAAQPTTLDLLMDERVNRENYGANSSFGCSTDTDSCDESMDETMSPTSMVVFKVPAIAAHNSSSSSSIAKSSSSTHTQCTFTLRKRQPKITEYMKERKRLSQTPKKLAPAAKRMRTSPNGSSSPTGALAPAPFHSSAGAHFSQRSQRHN